MQFTETLLGEHVVLIPAHEEDAEEIVLFAERFADVPRHFAFFAERPPTLEQERSYLKRMRESANDIVFIIRTPEGEFVGTCGLHDIDWRNENVRLGVILFNRELHSRGYGKEALATLLDWAFERFRYVVDEEERCGMHKAYVKVSSRNEIGMHIYVSLGFQYEGKLRGEYRMKYSGRVEYVDLYVMSLLKEEWQEGKGEDSDVAV